jgi:dipeptidyl-peptidase 4
MRTFFLAAAIATTHSFAQSTLTNKEIWATRTFSSEHLDGLNSMNDGQHYTALSKADGKTEILIHDFRTGARTGTLVSAEDLGTLDLQGYALSDNEQHVLLETNVEALYRHSYLAHHYVHDRTTRRTQALSDTAAGKQRLATISPDGTHAAFVRANDLFLVHLASGKETAVTVDGEMNRVINGATDWVYEEEFVLVRGYEWSPDGRYLAYLRSDEERVREYDLTLYDGQLYPSEYRYKYPKAGERNSTVSLHVYDVAEARHQAVPLADVEGEWYVPRLGWLPKGHTLWFMRMGRLQNDKVLRTVDLDNALAQQEIYHETSPTYIEVTDDLFWLEDCSGFVLTSERDGYNHIYRHDLRTKKVVQLTRGPWDVIAVSGVDQKRKRVLFQSAQRDAHSNEVYAVGLDGKRLQLLVPEGGTNEAHWSKGFNYFLNTRSTLNDPGTVALHDATGAQLKVLKDNAALRATLREREVPAREFMTIPLANGVELNAWMMKPPGFNAQRAYPVFMTQYSGPNSNEVLDQWDGRSTIWHALLAQKGYIVVCVDPRGTGRRGRDFRHITYRQLGKYESEDLVAAATWLGSQPYVDRARIGIQGWSYGGYMSSLCLAKGADAFKCAIAVAPVTNWRFYDSIYTERYMGLPQDNGNGYDDNSPLNHVANIKGAYLLVHGTADDNVHYQNTAELISALVRSDKRFEQFAYPDKNHGIYGGNTRNHLYEMMTRWLEENL